jgi:flagellar protein FliS
MDYSKITGALKQYRQTGAHEAVSGASPHRLIQLLFNGVLQNITTAKGLMLRKDNHKGTLISKSISILDELRQSLNFEIGGEIAENLNALYEYSQLRLLRANLKNDTALLDEVAHLLREIKSAWDAIAPSEKDNPPQARVDAG